MEFKFVPNQKPGKVDVTTLRRQKLVRRIDQQVGYVRSMIEGHDPRGSWVWMDEVGTYFVPIKYGRHIETHHIEWLARGGKDRIENTVALCPNCHRKMHLLDREADVRVLKAKASRA